MSIKSKVAFSVLSLAMAASANAGIVKNIQVYNNLYNQSATSGAAGMTSSGITVNYYNGATKCDSAVVAFRNLATEVVGTGQKCADVTSVTIVAGTSVINSSIQAYKTAAVTISMTAADYEHAIIIQDLGTGVTGTAASDGSIAPIFDATNGTVTTQGTLGYTMLESKIK
jgi:hypothetical protein